jgi:hypothetical protein
MTRKQIEQPMDELVRKCGYKRTIRVRISITSICYELQSRVDKDREPEQGRSRPMILEDLEKRIDELALNHAGRHDEDVKAELEKLRKQVAKMEERLR